MNELLQRIAVNPAICFGSPDVYRDIMENFDPAVMTLRKKRKIIFANRSLKDLL